MCEAPSRSRQCATLIAAATATGRGPRAPQSAHPSVNLSAETEPRIWPIVCRNGWWRPRRTSEEVLLYFYDSGFESLCAGKAKGEISPRMPCPDPPHRERYGINWRARRDLNPQPSDPKSEFPYYAARLSSPIMPVFTRFLVESSPTKYGRNRLQTLHSVYMAST
jgi:hypothetical protein